MAIDPQAHPQSVSPSVNLSNNYTIHGELPSKSGGFKKTKPFYLGCDYDLMIGVYAKLKQECVSRGTGEKPGDVFNE